MIITVTSHKGGVGKTVTAVHLAAYLSWQTGTSNEASTLLVDADPNHNALRWQQRGALPFGVVAEEQAAEHAPKHQHIVIDTQGRPGKEDLEALVQGCDLLVIPSMPDALSLDTLMLTIGELEELGRKDGYRVLLTSVPPWPIRSGSKARRTLEDLGVPLFDAEIRRREAFQKAAIMGVPVYDAKDRRATDGWNDYCRVAEEITTQT